MRISVREGGATKLKLVPSTSGSNRALSPMPKAAQANNHFDKKRIAIPRNNLVPITLRTEAPVNEEINGTIIFIYLLCFCFIPICYHLHFFIAIFVLHTKQVNQIQVQQLLLVLLVLGFSDGLFWWSQYLTRMLCNLWASFLQEDGKNSHFVGKGDIIKNIALSS